MSDQRIAFGPFVFDPPARALMRDGEQVPIGHRGCLILAKLLEAPGEVVGKNVLIDAAWPGLAIEESNLTVQIAALRKLLGVATGGGEWIETLPRVGYRFVGRARKVAGRLASTRTLRAAGSRCPAVRESQQRSGAEFLADGIVEDIITALSRFRTFAVVARNSTFAYKGRAVDVREVARELGVRYVLEGSVRRSGDRVRVTAQLIEGASGAHLWAEKFEGAVADIFDFQDEITRVGHRADRAADPQGGDRARPAQAPREPRCLGPLRPGAAAGPWRQRAGIFGGDRLLDRALALAPDYAPALALASWAHEKRNDLWRNGAAGDGRRRDWRLNCAARARCRS